MYALPVVQERIDVALHIPLDCCIIEELDKGSTKLIVTLPTSFVEIEDGDGGGLRAALAGIEKKLLALVQSLALQSDAGQGD